MDPVILYVFFQQNGVIMSVSITKQYKFVYIRRDDYFSGPFAKNDIPMLVVANKTPCKYSYYKGVTPKDFASFYLGDYSINHKSMNEVEWTTLLYRWMKKRHTTTMREMRDSNPGEYYYDVRAKKLPEYKSVCKELQNKIKDYKQRGLYTYLELVK